MQKSFLILVLLFTSALSEDHYENPDDIEETSDDGFYRISFREVYRMIFRRIKCDFILAKIDQHCDEKYDRIDQKSHLKEKKLRKICSEKLKKIRKKCDKYDDYDKCMKNYDILNNLCQGSIFDLHRQRWKNYYNVDEYCEKVYDKYDDVCEEKSFGDLTSIMKTSKLGKATITIIGEGASEKPKPPRTKIKLTITKPKVQKSKVKAKPGKGEAPLSKIKYQKGKPKVKVSGAKPKEGKKVEISTQDKGKKGKKDKKDGNDKNI